MKSNENIMTCFKKVRVHCKMTGLQSKVEDAIHDKVVITAKTLAMKEQEVDE